MHKGLFVFRVGNESEFALKLPINQLIAYAHLQKNQGFSMVCLV